MLRFYVKLVKRLSLRYASNPASQKKSTENIESPLWITCKRTEFNVRFCELSNKKFGEIPLASKGWMNKKSKGDHFKIHAVKNSYQTSSVNINFNEFNLDPNLVNNLKKMGISKATTTQYEAFNNIFRGEHTLIAAETGCGKTYAYLLPIIQKIIQYKQNTSRSFNTPLGLILTPSRELAIQIEKEAQSLCDGLQSKVEVKVVTGGRSKKLMLSPSFEDVDILVGSVGAVSKLSTTGIYRMHQVRHVVLDEADTLLDDSFHEKLEYFLSKFPVSFIDYLLPTFEVKY